MQEATYKQKHAFPYAPGAAEEPELAELMSPMLPTPAAEPGEGETKAPEEHHTLPFFNVVAVNELFPVFSV